MSVIYKYFDPQYIAVFKEHCNQMSCNKCEFNNYNDGCAFHGKPWEWNFEQIMRGCDEIQDNGVEYDKH